MPCCSGLCYPRQPGSLDGGDFTPGTCSELPKAYGEALIELSSACSRRRLSHAEAMQSSTLLAVRGVQATAARLTGLCKIRELRCQPAGRPQDCTLARDVSRCRQHSSWPLGGCRAPICKSHFRNCAFDPRLALFEPSSGCRRRARNATGKKASRGKAGKDAAATAAEEGGGSSSGEGNEQKASWLNKVLVTQCCSTALSSATWLSCCEGCGSAARLIAPLIDLQLSTCGCQSKTPLTPVLCKGTADRRQPDLCTQAWPAPEFSVIATFSGQLGVLQTSLSWPAQLQLTGHAAPARLPMAAPAPEQLLGSMGQQLNQRLDRREQAADLAMLRSILFSSMGPEVGATLAFGPVLYQSPCHWP